MSGASVFWAAADCRPRKAQMAKADLSTEPCVIDVTVSVMVWLATTENMWSIKDQCARNVALCLFTRANLMWTT